MKFPTKLVNKHASHNGFYPETSIVSKARFRNYQKKIQTLIDFHDSSAKIPATLVNLRKKTSTEEGNKKFARVLVNEHGSSSSFS